MICIGLTDLSMRTVAFEYDLFEKRGKFVFQSADYHFSPSVICDIRDGDVVGFLYDSDTAIAGFTINGIPQRMACLQDVPSKNASIINLPCCFYRFHKNTGWTSFVYSTALCPSFGRPLSIKVQLWPIQLPILNCKSL